VILFAQAYNYHGETLLAQDKCGDAIKCLEESQSRNCFSLFYFKCYRNDIFLCII